ncbi:MAG: methionine adenosyltransferase [Kiritimatiellae bacterium]|nr:methionine adenosyltransferase [Kiritimatiellia bacterium]
MATKKTAKKADIARPKGPLFTSESVSEGHPDKLCDAVSDAILDACLAQDPLSRVACETLAQTGLIVVAGEITTTAVVDYAAVARKAICKIGYDSDAAGFNGNTCAIVVALEKQSPDIQQGVDARSAEGKATAEQGAGDQGMMFGYACDESAELMPLPVLLAHRIMRKVTALRRAHALKWARPDAKSQVTVEYGADGKPLRVDTVVVSVQHDPKVTHAQIRKDIIEKVVKKVIPAKLLDADTVFHINPTGRFVVGGPTGDAGLTGRKVIVDSYGGMGRHGGGAFSGKDPSKVDRSAAYMARYIAKNIVAAKLANRCEVQLAYAIGYPDPVSVRVDTFGTGKVPEADIAAAVRKVFGLKPAQIIKQLQLLRPIYSKTNQYGHFGRKASDPDFDAFTWEHTDKVEALRQAVGK